MDGSPRSPAGATACSTTSATPRPSACSSLMGSGAETAHETVDWLVARGERVGVLKVRLYRPFAVERLRRRAAARPSRAIAVLDRTKEPGAVGEPLYLDVVTALAEARRTARSRASRASSAAATGCRPRSSRRPWSRPSSTSSRSAAPKNHFTVGIVDDVTHTVARLRRRASTSSRTTSSRAVFFGLGADGTVGANKNSIKIIGEETDDFAQGYFVYDSKKSGAVTISHLRFGPRPDPLRRT